MSCIPGWITGVDGHVHMIYAQRSPFVSSQTDTPALWPTLSPIADINRAAEQLLDALVAFHLAKARRRCAQVMLDAYRRWKEWRVHPCNSDASTAAFDVSQETAEINRAVVVPTQLAAFPLPTHVRQALCSLHTSSHQFLHRLATLETSRSTPPLSSLPTVRLLSDNWSTAIHEWTQLQRQIEDAGSKYDCSSSSPTTALQLCLKTRDFIASSFPTEPGLYNSENISTRRQLKVRVRPERRRLTRLVAETLMDATALLFTRLLVNKMNRSVVRNEVVTLAVVHADAEHAQEQGLLGGTDLRRSRALVERVRAWTVRAMASVCRETLQEWWPKGGQVWFKRRRPTTHDQQQSKETHTPSDYVGILLETTLEPLYERMHRRSESVSDNLTLVTELMRICISEVLVCAQSERAYSADGRAQLHCDTSALTEWAHTHRIAVNVTEPLQSFLSRI